MMRPLDRDMLVILFLCFVDFFSLSPLFHLSHCDAKIHCR